MSLRLSSAFAAAGCVLLASCHPFDENAANRSPEKPTQKTVSTPEQQKLQAERDQMKAKEEAAKKEAATTGTTTTEQTSTGNVTTPDGNGGTVTPPKDDKKEEKKDYAFANKVPGKDGFVFSPYNNKIVDVRDIPSGTLVQDPTYTGAGKGYFRVP